MGRFNYQVSNCRALPSSKWASRVTRVKSYCRAIAAIQMSFSGMGCPFCRSRPSPHHIAALSLCRRPIRAARSRLLYARQVLLYSFRPARTVVQLAQNNAGREDLFGFSEPASDGRFVDKQSYCDIRVKQVSTIAYPAGSAGSSKSTRSHSSSIALRINSSSSDGMVSANCSNCLPETSRCANSCRACTNSRT
jgi:hypothetical protein